LNNSTCIDIDECSETPSRCNYNQNCINTIGSYECKCKSGYAYIASLNSCVDINECDQDPCDSNSTCVNTDGSFLCKCKVYYTDVNGTCLFEERSIIQSKKIF
jgi:hypothetical protein